MRKFLYVLGFILFPLGIYAQEKYKVEIVGSNPENNDFTNDPRVELRFAYPEGTTQVMVSNSSTFKESTWQTVRPNLKWELTGKDGFKSVFVKFKDAAGKVSDATEDHINLDRTPPTDAKIKIDGGNTHTNSIRYTVQVEASAIDAYMVQFSNTKDFKLARWETPPKAPKTWILNSGDGVKTVYARFKDLAGNVSEPVSADIFLDLTPPEAPKILINNGAEYTNNRKLQLELHAIGATKMYISHIDEWIPYKPKMEITLPDKEGDRPLEGRVYVEAQFMDEAGNRTMRVSDDIIIDTQPPKETKIVINSGDRYTKSNDVSLIIAAIGASEMMLSNDPSFKGVSWQPFNIKVAHWDIGTARGEKKVYARFKDLAGNVSEDISGTINYDDEPPQDISVKIISTEASTNQEEGLVDLKLNATGADYMMISNDMSFQKARWETYRPNKEKWVLGSANEDGDKAVYVKFRDKAGNVSEVVSDKVHLDRIGPIDCKIRLIPEETGYVKAKDGIVKVQVFARGADKMQLANEPSFEGVAWQPYSENTTWQLQGADGEKWVYARFMDKAGNMSRIKNEKTGKFESVVSDKVVWDRTPPEDVKIIINRGEPITNNTKVIINVEATDERKGKMFMMISSDAKFQGARWDGYNEANIIWKLEGEDGNKTIFAKFKDEAGNESSTAMAQIILDRRPPMKGSVKIVGSHQPTKTQSVMLQISAEGEPTEMQVSNHFDFRDAEWEPYKTTKSHILVDDDGLKTVFVRFKDAIGNCSQIAYDKIGLDRRPPTGETIRINNGDKYSTALNRQVTLRLYAKDAKEMMISNFPDFSKAEWEPYQIIKTNWTLEDKDTTHYVYVKFRDEAGNESKSSFGQIISDTQGPFNEDIKIDTKGQPCTNAIDLRVTLKIKAEGANKMMISNDKFFNPSLRWEDYKEEVVWRLQGRDGKKTVFIKFKDEAGNESGVAQADIILDTQAPIPGVIRINKGENITKESTVILRLNAQGADLMQVSNDPNFTGMTEWINYSEIYEHNLSPGSGRRTVYVRFRDSCGNEVRPISQSITVAYE